MTLSTIILSTITFAAISAIVGLIVAALLGYLLRHLIGGDSSVTVDREDWEGRYHSKSDEYDQLRLEYKNRKSKISDLEKDRDGWMGKYNGITPEIDSLKSTIEKRDIRIAELEGAENYEKHYNDLKVDFDKKYEELEALKGKYDGSDSELDRLKKELSTSNASIDDLKKQADEWKGKYESYGPNLKKLESENGDLKIAAVGRDNLIKELKSKLSGISADNSALAALQSDFSALQTKHNNVEPELAKLKSKNSDLEASVSGKDGRIAELEKLNGDLLKQVESEKANTEALKSKIESSGGSAEAMDKLEAEKAALNKDLENCNDDYNSMVADNNSLKAKLEKLEATVKRLEESEDDTEDDVLSRIKSKSASIDFARIGSADGKDDLKVIKGVGPFSERKLNALGISTYRQIANFNEEDIDKVNDAIEFFPGRVKRDDWVGQAKILIGQGGAAKASSASSGATSKEDKEAETMRRIREKAANIDFERIGKADESQKDDLKRINGIGPFIERKLNALGIYTFKQISNLTEDDADKVNDAIEFFPGRAKRDNWIGQAKELINS